MSREVITRDNWQPGLLAWMYSETLEYRCPCRVAMFTTGRQPGVVVCGPCKKGRWMPEGTWLEVVPDFPVTLLPGCESGCCPTVAA